MDLIVGSIGRLSKLSRLLNSLQIQRSKNFRVLVVEQVDPDGASDLLKREASEIAHVLMTSDRGLSRARNRALGASTADIIGFPDDDCWYEEETLQRVVETFGRRPELDFLIGVLKSPSGRRLIRTPIQAQAVTRRNVWRVAISPAVFVRASSARRIGGFDDRLGVGSGTAFQSGEETDFVLRGLEQGQHGIYDPLLVVRHPSFEIAPGRLSATVGRGYGLGMGLVLRRHSYGMVRALIAVVRPVMGAAIASLRGDRDLAIFRVAVAQGRFAGYFLERLP